MTSLLRKFGEVSTKSWRVFNPLLSCSPASIAASRWRWRRIHPYSWGRRRGAPRSFSQCPWLRSRNCLTWARRGAFLRLPTYAILKTRRSLSVFLFRLLYASTKYRQCLQMFITSLNWFKTYSDRSPQKKCTNISYCKISATLQNIRNVFRQHDIVWKTWNDAETEDSI